MATANPLQPEAFDPVLDAMARAPVVRRLEPEQRAELDQAVADLAAAISTVTGKTVVYTPVSTEQHEAILRSSGLDEGTIGFVTTLDSNIADGVLAETSGELRELIGRPTTPLVEGLAAALQS